MSLCPFYFIFRTCGGHYIFQFNALMFLIAFHLESALQCVVQREEGISKVSLIN